MAVTRCLKTLSSIEPPDVAQNRGDLAVAEDFAIGGHGAPLALLDALDEVFVAALGVRQFRTPALVATAIRMAKAAGGREHLLAIDVIRRGSRPRRICGWTCRRTCRRRRLRRRRGRQPRPDDGRGCNDHKLYSHSVIHADRHRRQGTIPAAIAMVIVLSARTRSARRYFSSCS